MAVSIRTRLLLLTVAVLLPAMASALWVINRAWQDERKAMDERMRDTTHAMSLVVDRELSQRAVLARLLSLSRNLDNAPELTTEDLLLFEQQARRTMQGMRGWVELNSADRRLLSTQRPASMEGMPLQSAALSRPGLVDTPVTGALVAAGPGTSFRAALTHPVERDGRKLLDLSVTILPEELQAIIDLQRLPSTWIATILDAQGTVVARHPGGSRFVGRPSTSDLDLMRKKHREASFESVSLDGTPVVAYFSTSPLGWSYVMAVPRAELASGSARALLPLAAGSLLMLVAAMAAALWVSRRIVTPIDALNASAAALRAGHPVAMASTGIVECDAVSLALSEASVSITQAQSRLQLQVEEAIERTRDAEQRVSQGQRIEALGRLTGGVAHDFNNLLGVISNSAHLIQRLAALGKPATMPVEAILRAVDVGSRLTQHLVRFAGRQPVRPQPVELASYLAEVQELIGTVLSKRIQLAVEVAPGTRAVKVDVAELELALINMALNARDAIDGTGQVWLRARNADPADGLAASAGPHVVVSFSDNGHGVTDALTERVFEPFFTTKPVGKGTGLGLSQVHGFCVQAGGIARLASSEGQGTTVQMLLPACDEQATLQPTRVPLNGSELRGVRVLLVDDNDELGRITEALLTSFGCIVDRARLAREALDLFDQAESYDVVLSDVVMPGEMDGLALARRLRARQPDLPVVLISGFSEALAGANEFVVLRKPCAPAQLLETLTRAMKYGRRTP